MGRATALDFVTDWVTYAVSHSPPAAAEAPESPTAGDNRDFADGNWESAWIDLGGEG
jgi:hypothetical protein